MAVHPNSIANLGPAWQPGQSGNPNGRVPIGLSYQEWMNALDTHDDDGVAKYDQAALEQIRDDPTQCRAKRGAAADLLDMPRADYDKAVPLRANVIDRVCDRTVGKPVKSVHVTKNEMRPFEVIHADLIAVLDNVLTSLSPAERAEVLARHMPVDTTAEAIESPPVTLPAPDSPTDP